MIITGMNRFFAKHGRIAFFLIAVVISFAFVMFMTGQSLFDIIMQRNTRPANFIILGREVTQKERIDAVDVLLIQQAIKYPEMGLMDSGNGRFDQMGVNNLMLRYAAEDRGIAIGNKAISEYIKSIPALQTDGKFDSKKFNKFIDDKLKPRYFNKSDLDDAIAAQLAVEKLTKDITESVIIPAAEIKESFLNINEKAKVQTCEFEAKSYLTNVKVDEKEAQSYFESNKNNYMTPSAIKINFVRFEYGKYKTAAWKEVTEKDIEKYYNDNKYLYIIKEAPKKVVKGKKDKKPAVTKYQDLKSVSSKIKTKLATEKAKELASKAANDFSDDAYDLTKDVFYNIKDKAEAAKKCHELFANFAKNKNKKLFNSEWIYKGDKKIKGLGNEVALIKASENLFIDNPVSENIKGDKAAFVAILLKKQEPQPENWDKVKLEVIAELKDKKMVNLAREAARDATLKLSEALDKKEKFSDIVKKLKLKFSSLPQELTVSRPLYAKNGQIIQSTAFETKEGEISAVKEISSGALIVYVENKSFPSDKEFEKQKAMFTMRYKMMKQQTIWRSYVESLNAASTTN